MTRGSRHAAGRASVRFPRDAVATLHRHFTGTGSWRTIREQRQARSDLANVNRRNAEQVRPVPSRNHLRELLDVTYAASLMEEEGRRISLAVGYLSAEGASALGFKVFPFKQALAFSSRRLAKVALATDPARTTVGVWPSSSGQLKAWGLIHHGDHTFAIDLKFQPTYLSLRVLRPGTFTAHFDERLALLFSRDHFHIFTKKFDLLGTLRDGAGLAPAVAEALCRLAKRMLAHGHGGTLLVTDEQHTPEGLTLHSAFTSKNALSLLKDALELHEGSGAEPGMADAHAIHARSRLEEQHDDALDFVAQLSAVDGAVVLRTDLNLLGFGATISTPERSVPRHVTEAHPKDGRSRKVTIDKIGGNRHRSAICFCAQQKGTALALVASQDGDLSLFGRRDDGSVHVIRPFELGVGI